MLHLPRIRLAQVVQPAHAEVQAADVLILPRSGNGFVHCRNSFAKAAKVCLENSHMKKSVLVIALISSLHGVVKVAVQILERVCVVACPPCIEEASFAVSLNRPFAVGETRHHKK